MRESYLLKSKRCASIQGGCFNALNKKDLFVELKVWIDMYALLMQGQVSETAGKQTRV